MKDGHAKISGGTRPLRTSAERAASSTRSTSTTAGWRRIVKACRDLPGLRALPVRRRRRANADIDSADVNAYLREISGQDFTAKDFRTWAGTVLAAQALAAGGRFSSNAEAKRNVVRAIESVAKRLGNTKAVCRKCYIHPAILDAYMDGATIRTIQARARQIGRPRRSDRGERAVVA